MFVSHWYFPATFSRSLAKVSDAAEEQHALNSRIESLAAELRQANQARNKLQDGASKFLQNQVRLLFQVLPTLVELDASEDRVTQLEADLKRVTVQLKDLESGNTSAKVLIIFMF